MPRVALILPDVVQEAGMRAIVERYFSATEVESFPEPEGVPGEHFDLYITDSETFAANVDFFLPRRSQCAVLVSGTGERTAAGGETPPRIGTGDTIENLLERVGRLLNPEPKSPGRIASDELSAREIQVLQLVVSGAINKEIADRLHISLNTVLTHRKNITAKLGIKTISGLTLYALMHGYISTDTITG
ncbi:MAG: helix-turn-helix transcriptional regulator [Rikenella sp.]|nr:helix-turn-helix transcriptional regulator [Rikenella sp.]